MENEIDNIILCLSSEIDDLHYQSREYDRNKLRELLVETKDNGNLVTELITALERHLKK